MSGLSYADPATFDMTAASGSTTFTVTGGAAAPWVYHDSANTSTDYFPATAGVDGDLGTCWETHGVDANTWYALAAGDASDIDLTDYQLRQRPGWSGRAPSDWTIDGSNDGSSWTTVDTRTGITDWDGSGDVRTFTLASPVTYTYIRIKVTATAGGDIVNLAEFYLNGEPNPAASTVYYYVQLLGLPENRVYTCSTAAGSTNLASEYGAWRAYVGDYPEGGDTTGSSSFASTSDFYAFGDWHGAGIILRFKLTGYGTFDWTWTSTDHPARPNTWFNPDALDPTGGLVTYDGVNNDAPTLPHRRFYTITPTTTDVITLSTDEPNGYFEVYRETGLTSYDEFVEDGYNDGTGAIDPDGGACAFTPTSGQTYVVVLFPNGEPDLTSTYTLTLTAESVPPPPYIVPNDTVAGALAAPVPDPAGTIAYDNTGASDEGGAYPGKRSIFFSLSPAQTRYIEFTTTPGDGDPGNVPVLSLFTGGSPVSLSTTSVGKAAKLTGGTDYILMLTFPSSIPTTPWDADGLITYAVVVPGPADEESTAPVLTGGTGQTTTLSPVFAGSSLRVNYFTIVAPIDGAFCHVLESDNPSALTDGSATVTDANGVVFNTPERASAATTPAAGTITVKAGDVLKVRLQSSAAGGLIFRWGMSTEVAYYPWRSAHFNDALLYVSPSTPTSPYEGVTSWQAQFTSTTPDGISGGTRYQSLGNSRVDRPWTQVYSDRVQAQLEAQVAGTPDPGFDVSYDAADGGGTAYATIGSWSAIDGGGDWQRTTTDLVTNGQAQVVVYDYENESSAGVLDTEANRAKKKFYYDNLPVLYTSAYGDLTLDPFSIDQQIATLRQHVVEWSSPNVLRYDLFRGLAFGASRLCYGTDGDQYTLPVSIEVSLWKVGASVDAPATNPWLSPDEIAAGEMLGTWTAPSGYGAFDEDSTGLWAVRDSAKVATNVFAGGHPGTGTTVYNDRYAVLTNVYSTPGEVDYDDARLGVLAAASPAVDGSPATYTTVEVSGRAVLAQEVRRVYPDQFRLGTYAENLELISTDETAEPLPGYYIHPMPNLDGEGHGVDVSFASAT